MATKEDFEMEDGHLYFGAPGRSPLLKETRLVGEAALRLKSSPWQILDSTADVEAIRSLFGQVVGCKADEVCVMPSTSYTMSFACENLVGTAKPGQKVVVLNGQMASNVLPWQRMCTKSSGTLCVLPRPEDFDWTSAIRNTLEQGDVYVVAVPNCHWTDGSLIDLTRVSEACERHDAHLVLDLTQSAGAFPVDLSALKVTIAACSVHKWLFGAYGTCLAYLNPSVYSSWQPLEEHERVR